MHGLILVEGSFHIDTVDTNIDLVPLFGHLLQSRSSQSATYHPESTSLVLIQIAFLHGVKLHISSIENETEQCRASLSHRS